MSIEREVDRVFARDRKTRKQPADEPDPLGPPPEPGPIITRLADVKPEPIEWLWKPRIALGKLTMVAGDPGLGKSFVTLDFAARVSTGTAWPDNRDEPQQAGDVVLLSAEDDLADTIRPRLDVAQADCSRIIALQAVRVMVQVDNKTTKTIERTFSLEADLKMLEAALDYLPNPRLVVIDPISAYIGTRLDSHKNADMRAVLSPLAALASRRRVAVLAVNHLNKGGSQTNALYRTMGSLAFVAAARSSWLIVADAHDPGRRLFLCVKNNLGPDQGGLAYSLMPAGDLVCVAWEPESVKTTADEALAAGRRDVAEGQLDHSSKVAEASTWLTKQLGTGIPILARDLATKRKAAGLSEYAVRTAAAALGVRSRKTAEGWWLLPPGGQNQDVEP